METSAVEVCLSVRQPWATLLVHGIKTIEGRSWSTKHRGRLWIAACKKLATRADLDLVHHLYGVEGSRILQQKLITGSIVGSVHITDCVTRKEYEDGYGKKDCFYTFAWLCERSYQLTEAIPVSGKYRICNLYSCTTPSMLASAFEYRRACNHWLA